MAERGTAPPDLRHRSFAWIYPRIARAGERKGAGEHRQELLAGLSGRVVEIGAGHGLNFRHYPSTVTEVVAIEPEPRLRSLAEVEARKVSVTIRVEPGVAEALPLGDDTCDAAVLSLVLCSISDVDRALAEVRRVLRRGGQVRFYEHVRSPAKWVANVQRVADVAWPHLAGGCHLSRDSVGAMDHAGFEVTKLRQFSFLTLPHVIGTAVVPPA